MDADKVKEILMKVKNGEWDWEEASEALGGEQKNEQQSSKADDTQSDEPKRTAAKKPGSKAPGSTPSNEKGQGAENKGKNTSSKTSSKNTKRGADKDSPTASASKAQENPSGSTGEKRQSQQSGSQEQSERFQQDLGDFFKGMEEMGKTLAKGIESTVKEISKNFRGGPIPNPFESPRDVAFFYSKQEGDQEPKPIWNIKIPLQFFMGFRGLLVGNPKLFGDPPPFDFVKIYQELDDMQEGRLWSMEKSDTGEYWEVKLMLKSD